MIGIYKITNIVNGKCYIGKSENIVQRLKTHITDLRNGCHANKYLQNAYNLNGKTGFTIEIIEALKTSENINDREKYWIAYYQSNNKDFGYNRTSGGDGGNSYVDCMTEEEREEHYKRHRELRLGDNNSIYGKHLYTDGIQQKYISEDEIEIYIKNGWHRGANDFFKENCRKRNSGENNPFYGKTHSKETVEKIKQTKQKNGFDMHNTLKYYKNGKYKFIKPCEVNKYEEEGWTHGTSDDDKKKIRESKLNHFKDEQWRKEHIKNISNHYEYNNEIFYGINELILYLKEHGYPKIGKRTVQKLLKNKTINKYSDLVSKIKVIKKKGE